MPAALLEAYWSPVVSRELRREERYFFVVVTIGAPSSLEADTALQVQLEAMGWQIVSVGAPPADALNRPELKAVNDANARSVIGVWKGQASVLPDVVGKMLFGPLFVWYQPSGPAPEPVDPATGGPVVKSTAWQWIIGIGATGAIVGLLALVARHKDRGMIATENPGRLYLLDGIPMGGTLESFFRLNDFDDEERRRMRALKPGQSYTGGGGAWAQWTLTRASENPTRNPTPCIERKHVGGCRPGRPSCRFRRRAKGLCYCDLYPYPHRIGSCAKKEQAWLSRRAGESR